MNKTYLLSIPLLALVAAAGIAAAQPLPSISDMTQEEKGLRIQMLELRQEMIQNQMAYLNEEITQEQFQERMQAHLDEMQPLREQLREMSGNGEPGACGFGRGRAGFGPWMMGG